jgi:N-acetylmuramic acid 6-phosphate etherase
MKAGTAEKLVLNMISTGSMARLGYVYDNLMVHVRLKNSKLIERGTTIVATSTGLQRNAARKLLRSAGNDVAVAIVIAKANVSRSDATWALKTANGSVRKAITLVGSRL